MQEVHLLAKEARSPLQNAALVKWKTPNWVLAEARPLTKQSDPKHTSGDKHTPDHRPTRGVGQMAVEISQGSGNAPRILRACYAINLSSVRGMLMVMARALRGAIAHRTWSAFLIRAAQLISTPGLYWHLVDDLCLTIAMTPCVTLAQMSDNITVEDVVRLFTGDGITIPQTSDAFEWGQMALAGWSAGSDASRQTEAMQAMILTCEQTSCNDQDRLVLLEPRWWYPSTGALETMVVEQTTTMEELTVHMAHDQVPPEVPVKLLEMPSNRGGWTWPEAPKITKPLSLVDDGVVGWMGSHVYYIQRKPKKKRKSKVTQRREEEALSSDEPYELEEKIDDCGEYHCQKGPQEGPTTTQNRTLLGTADNDVPMEQG